MDRPSTNTTNQTEMKNMHNARRALPPPMFGHVKPWRFSFALENDLNGNLSFFSISIKNVSVTSWYLLSVETLKNQAVQTASPINATPVIMALKLNNREPGFRDEHQDARRVSATKFAAINVWAWIQILFVSFSMSPFQNLIFFEQERFFVHLYWLPHSRYVERSNSLGAINWIYALRVASTFSSLQLIIGFFSTLIK